MADFIATIHGTENNTNHYFAFRSAVTPDGLKFYVTTLTSDHQTVRFDMRADGDDWVIVPPVPTWIIKLQEQLSDAINSNSFRS